MSDLSIALLEYNFDYLLIIQKRIENYQILNNYLNEFALFPELTAGVVPLGYPIRLEKRVGIRRVLFENNIYPSVHWLIDIIVPRKFMDSHRLAGTIMTLVCDQRYNAVDMEKQQISSCKR
jgi:hypothetical protein